MRLPLFVAVRLCSNRTTVMRDIMRSLNMDPANRSQVYDCGTSFEEASAVLHAMRRPEVRTVFYYRLGHGTLLDRLIGLVLRIGYPGQVGVEIECDDIGPGWVLAHGQCSLIGATRIGSDFTVCQNVTIGLRAGDTEYRLVEIGDRVWIWGGSMITGANLGDDATVGAMSLVLTDVPAGATVFGVPARPR